MHHCKNKYDILYKPHADYRIVVCVAVHSCSPYQSAPFITPTVCHRQCSCLALRLLFPQSSEEFSVTSERSVGLCSHVARERLILCAHSACRQTAGHNSSFASNSATTHTGPPLSSSAARALTHLRWIGQALISACKKLQLCCWINAVPSLCTI